MSLDERRRQTDEQKIEDIVIALGTYALNDIRDTYQRMPVAAFILSSCLIDQMAAFRYDHKQNENAEHYKLFLETYLSKYIQLNLYTSLRCNLVHGYSIDKYLSLMSEDDISSENESNISASNLSAKTLYFELKQVFDVLKNEFYNNAEIRANALTRFDKFPPLIAVKRGYHSYEHKEVDFLIPRYLTKLLGKCINHNPQLPITDIIPTPAPNGNFYLKTVTDIIADGKPIWEDLEIVAVQHGFKRPIKDLLQMR